jgi:hypothetical protein
MLEEKDTMDGSSEEKNVFSDGNDFRTYAITRKKSDFVGFFGGWGGGRTSYGSWFC